VKALEGTKVPSHNAHQAFTPLSVLHLTLESRRTAFRVFRKLVFFVWPESSIFLGPLALFMRIIKRCSSQSFGPLQV